MTAVRFHRALPAWICALLIAAGSGQLAAQEAGPPSDPGPADRPRRHRAHSPVRPRVFLRAEAVPPRPYVGQQVLFTLYLYTDADVGSILPRRLPDFRGFWSRTLPLGDPLPEPVADSELYRVALLQEALFPRRGGRLEIPPIAASMEAKVRQSGDADSPAHRVVRESNPVAVEVRELPPAPPGFHGAVGQITLDAELAPRQLEVGEAATLTLTVRGRGHLQGIPAPELPLPDGLEVFSPQQASAEKLLGTEVGGSRAWSYVLVPQRPGSWLLPAVEMPYFDPRQERYLTARGPELELVAASSTRFAEEDGQTVELHPIRTAALPVAAGGWFDASGLRPWLFGLPWVLALVLLRIRRRRGDSGHTRAREELLERLRSADEESRPRPAAAAMEEAWRDFLQARWGIPRGTPSTRWGSLLADRGADEGTAGGLVELADDLHYLRYAPKLAAAEGLRRELRDRSRKLLRGLR